MLLSFILFCCIHVLFAFLSTKQCDPELMPHYVIPEGLLNIKRCLPCHCLKPDKIKCEENVALKNCVADNSWIADFTKFDNFTNDLIEVKCCKYIEHTHTALSQVFNFTNTKIVKNSCATNNSIINSFGIYVLNNIKKIDTINNSSLYSASINYISCPPKKGWSSSFRFDSLFDAINEVSQLIYPFILEKHHQSMNQVLRNNLSKNDKKKNISGAPFYSFDNLSIPNAESKEILNAKRDAALKEAKILKYLIKELNNQATKNVTYDSSKIPKEYELVKSILKSSNSKEQSLLMANKYQEIANKKAEGVFGDLFGNITNNKKENRLHYQIIPYENILGVSNASTTTKLPCNINSMPRYLQYDWVTGVLKYSCLPCHCLNPDKIKCEESVALKNCVADNSWIADFTKFDNFTNDLIEVKCCKYTEHTHTALISLKFFTYENVTSEPCENFEEFIPQMSFIFINNMSKLTARKYKYSLSRFSCPHAEGFESTIRFDSEKTQQFDDNLRHG